MGGVVGESVHNQRFLEAQEMGLENALFLVGFF